MEGASRNIGDDWPGKLFDLRSIVYVEWLAVTSKQVLGEWFAATSDE